MQDYKLEVVTRYPSGKIRSYHLAFTEDRHIEKIVMIVIITARIVTKFRVNRQAVLYFYDLI